ncbi:MULTISPECIES: hypothetical protein [unclassified Streptomyces]|nr:MULTISPECIES: hypothetical protein [unclassified Streptomyces]WSC34864.1 hypothetical protein OHA08_04595 [Streptomyces sp. NBC_01763]WSC57861.1 hypothetical protein OG808_39715 [Streptomyces sp. NBC_01761]WSF88964.1 hypothetical protein OIE70_41260 [Streptomyces sp. NBC_01744]WSG79723.1 hypothetical protein OIE76_07155 [Streptomyces sp. NBC_01727]
MSPQNDPSSASHFPPKELVHGVLARFDTYARIRGGRDSIFESSRTTPQQEQRAFDDLAQAITRLRNTL